MIRLNSLNTGSKIWRLSLNCFSAKLISESVPDFTRLSLVDLPPTVPPVAPGEEENIEETEDGIQLSPKPSSAMKSQLKTPENSSQSKSPEHAVEDKNTR